MKFKKIYTTREKIAYFESKIEALRAKLRAEEALKDIERRLAALEERDLRDTQKRDTI